MGYSRPQKHWRVFGSAEPKRWAQNINMFAYRWLRLASSMLLALGLAIPTVAMTLLLFIRSNHNIYLWVIGGPYPFSHMGSGPFVLWNGVGLLVFSAGLVAVALFMKRHYKRTAQPEN